MRKGRDASEKNRISGAVILYESYAAIHTYSQLRAAFLDIFSCIPLWSGEPSLRINESPVTWPFQS
jgi:S-adenosylmethionine/arginine decarboxylase-like enzyme